MERATNQMRKILFPLLLCVCFLLFSSFFTIEQRSNINKSFKLAESKYIEEKLSSENSPCEMKVINWQDPCTGRVTAKHGKYVPVQVSGIQFNMFVYNSVGHRDIVSETIAQSKAWEKLNTEKVFSLFPKNQKGVLLDAGANVGWFSMVGFHLGHDIIAFEPFEKNVDLICSSLALEKNTRGKNKFTLHQLGLDYKQRNCELFQIIGVNIGDTHTVCSEGSRRLMENGGYKRLGWMNTTTLDDALLNGWFDNHKVINLMKIDVEGFEPAIISGANKFFQSKYAPKYIIMEMVGKMMGVAFGNNERGGDYLKSTLLLLHNHGYEIDEWFLNQKGRKNMTLANTQLVDILAVVDGHDVLFKLNDNGKKKKM